ncbi:MAG: hypothetical protein ACRYFV_14730 [Janthinobacterium lividum]|jgi:hypothetical protein
MPSTTLKLYYESAVGRLLEQPAGEYIVVEYNAGPRKLIDLQAFLHHAGLLLERRNWYKMLGDQRLMSPFTPEESKWITSHWLSRDQQRNSTLYGAVLLPHDVFARLSVSQVMNEAKAASMMYRLFMEKADAIAWLAQIA